MIVLSEYCEQRLYDNITTLLYLVVILITTNIPIFHSSVLVYFLML